jgi:ribonuclease P protein component
MVVFALAREEAPERGWRLGVTATRKIGGAVVRARSKRRLREVFRIDTTRQLSRAADIVINARRGCATAPWDELQRDYERCVKKLAGLLEGG